MGIKESIKMVRMVKVNRGGIQERQDREGKAYRRCGVHKR